MKKKALQLTEKKKATAKKIKTYRPSKTKKLFKFPDVTPEQVVHSTVGDILSRSHELTVVDTSSFLAETATESEFLFNEFNFHLKNPSSPSYGDVKMSMKLAGIHESKLSVVLDTLSGSLRTTQLMEINDLRSAAVRRVKDIIDMSDTVTRVTANGETYETRDPRLTTLSAQVSLRTLEVTDTVFASAKEKKQAEITSSSGGITVNVLSVSPDKTYKI